MITNTKSRVGLHGTQKRPVLQQVQVIAVGLVSVWWVWQGSVNSPKPERTDKPTFLDPTRQCPHSLQWAPCPAAWCQPISLLHSQEHSPTTDARKLLTPANSPPRWVMSFEHEITRGSSSPCSTALRQGVTLTNRADGVRFKASPLSCCQTTQVTLNVWI